MRQFVTRNEAVLVKFQGKAGVYIQEARVEQAVTPIDEALAGMLDDDTIQVMLLDMDTLRAEDITDEAVKIFLDGWKGDPDEDQPPAFVKQSDAFEAWAEEYRIERGFNERKHHGTYNARAL